MKIINPSKKVNLNIRPGDIINKETVTFKALALQQKITEYKEDQLFATPYYGISNPIVNDGKPQGCITIILTREQNLFPTSLLPIRTSDRRIPVY